MGEREATMITVHVLRMERDLSPTEYCGLMGTVSSKKQKQVERFLRYEGAQQTLLGEVLIRKMLKDRFGLSNSAIVFETNTFGKPFLRSHPACHFNISHAKNYVVGAVGCSPVGIDVEAIGQMNGGVTDRFFTSQEKQYLFDHPNSERPSAFCRIWTRKEAYIKREGGGLSIPLNSVNVLDAMDDTHFHLIFENKEAVCHVCSCEAMPPTVKRHTVDGFFAAEMR